MFISILTHIKQLSRNQVSVENTLMQTSPEAPAQPDLTSYDRIVVFFSGGKDSVACVLHLLDLGVPRSKIELQHHDIDGREGSSLMDWPVTPAYVQAFGDALGLPVYFSWRVGGFERELKRENCGTAPITFTRGDGTLVTMGGERSKANTRRRFPQVSADLRVRWCSSSLKIEPGDRLLCNDPRFMNSRTLVVTGERAEESPGRARYSTFEPHRKDLRHNRSKARHIDHWRPVHAWSEERVPVHPVVKVFDLKSHEFFWVHSDNMTPYEYDKSLREKLILPPTHRDLLDVLTSDLGAFVNDFIEGKSAGNVILCKGIPGVGKTLTAEVYAELIDRPLYAIHSGSLGTTAEDIEKNLQVIFKRGKRWDCVLLLDEADVFVVQRGNNIQQNAIVAEFLRTLEYFDGLLFMTTNRPNDIDEAIISRCAAIIDYAPPSSEDAAAIWRVMATQYAADLPDQLIDELVTLFPEIAPRDIKMLFRLALRVAAAHKEPLSLSTFRRCAMFRAIKMKGENA